MTPKSSDYGRVFFQAEVFRAGRHISCDATSHSFLREIPQCRLTGRRRRRRCC